MIHNNSKDPVLIKKIALRIWTLRDEVEAVIKAKQSGNSEPVDIIKVLKEEYSKKAEGAGAAEGGEIQSGEAAGLDDFGEDEMARAIAEAEAAEAAGAEGEGAEDSTDQAQEETGQASEEAIELEVGKKEKEGSTYVAQRTPTIPAEKLFSGSSFLSEINMEHMFFFASTQFLQGQSIVIEFLVPRRFVLNANVLFCRNYNIRSRIISANSMPFRVGVEFSFLKEGERTLLREFVESIEPEVEVQPEAPQKQADDDDDFDVFDELDD